MEKKGVVMEIHHQKAVILTPDGAFEDVRLKKNTGLKVGDELHSQHILGSRFFHRHKIRKRAWIPVMAACVTALLIFVLSGGLFQNHAVAAYISLDGGPSIEAAVDKNLDVVSVNAINNTDPSLIKDAEKYRNQSLETFMNHVIPQMKKKDERGKESIITVTSAVSKNNKEKATLETKIAATVKKLQPELIKVHGKLDYVKTSMKTRNQARKAGLSTGKFVAYLKASKADPSLSPKAVKTLTITEIKKGSKRTGSDQAQSVSYKNSGSKQATDLETKSQPKPHVKIEPKAKDENKKKQKATPAVSKSNQGKKTQSIKQHGNHGNVAKKKANKTGITKHVRKNVSPLKSVKKKNSAHFKLNRHKPIFKHSRLK